MTRAVACLLALPLLAGDPSGFALWSAPSIKRIESKLAGPRFASHALGKFGNHYMMVASRQGIGSAELHETETDVFLVESGAAKLVIGGTIVNPKPTAPHEIRGTSLRNGTVKSLSSGDIVHIPARMPHQLMVASGQFTYLVVKLKTQ